MQVNYDGNKIKNMTYDGYTVKKWINDDVPMYSAGNSVTYYVDSQTVYTEEVDSGNSCLNPTTFTPSKSGYVFAGWREDNTANGTVLTNKVMGDNPITLYAVFRKTITLSIRISGATTTQTGYQYYNNGTVANPAFTVANPTKSGGTFLGWSTSSTSTTVSYSTISNRVFSTNTTIYSLFKFADTTVSPTSGGSFVESNAFFLNTENRKTIYGSVDTSKYYAAQLTLAYAYSSTAHRGQMLQVYVSDGTNNTRIVYSYVDWTGNNGSGQSYADQGRNLNPTLTFSSSSGTKPIYLRTINSVYASSEQSGGTVASYNVGVSSIKLLGRTSIG